MLTAAFFVPELTVQKREQREDCADDVENEVEPIKLVHDITPSLSRGKPSRFKSGGTIWVTYEPFGIIGALKRCHTFRKFSSVLR